MATAKIETETREEKIERIASGFFETYENIGALIIASYNNNASSKELDVLDDLKEIIEYIVGENLSDDELDDFEALMKLKTQYEPILSQKIEHEKANSGYMKQLDIGQLLELLAQNFPCPDTNNKLVMKIYSIYTNPLYKSFWV